MINVIKSPKQRHFGRLVVFVPFLIIIIITWWFYLSNFIGYHAVTWHSVKFDIVDIDNNFDFQNITAERVEKIINTINIKKSYWCR